VASTNPKESPNENTIRYLFYTDLHYIPKAWKDEVWAAQNIVFAKMHSKPLVDPSIAYKRRMADRSEINAQDYKEIFDPKDEKGGGGKAEFVAADWKANPINLHINNIVETNLEKIPINMFCSANDEFAMQKQQKVNKKMLGRKQFTDFLNEFNRQMGLPKLNPTEDPFKYAEEMKSKMQASNKRIQPDGLMEAIKAAVSDNEDIALFNEFIYKGDVEIAIEIILARFRQDCRWEVLSEKVIPDLRNFNTASIGWFTSKTTGMVEKVYYDPATVYTSSFGESDGGDIVYWFREWDISFGDFVRMFGAELEPEDLKRIFEKHKAQFTAHGIDFNRSSDAEILGAKIRIGRIEFETQNCDRFASGNVNGNFSYKEVDHTYKPSPNTPKKFQKVVEEKHYNMWYSCFYIPYCFSPNVGQIFADADYREQSKFIFDLRPIQDHIRYGDDNRYAKHSLIIWKSQKVPFAEIMERFMPKIHLLWQKYQNEIVQDQNGVVYAEEMLQSMMTIVDANTDDHTKAKLEMLRYLKQTGNAVAKFTDADGKHFKPFEQYSSGQMEAATRTLENMMNLYMVMTRSLAISEVTEGVDPKPRQSLGGLRISAQGGNNATFMLEKGYTSLNVECGRRDMWWIEKVVSEGDASERYKYLVDFIGQANGLNLQTIKDIPSHRLGLHIDNLNTDEQKQKLDALAEQLVKAGMMDVEVLSLIIKITNYKYAAVLMVLKYKQKQRQIMEQKEQEFMREMQLKQMELKIEQQRFMAKAQAEAFVVNVSKQWDERIAVEINKLKAQTQAQIKDVMKNNRIEQDTNQARLDEEQKQREKQTA
jgi:hypothetical protein